MKSISLILSLFFIGASPKISAVESQYSMPFLQKTFLAKNAENLIKSKIEKKISKPKKEIQKKPDSKTKKKRAVAGEAMAYTCSEVGSDEFSFGYVQVGSKCAPDANFCLAFSHVERNYCEGDKLIRFYCDPKQFALYSKEKIKCEKGCEFKSMSGSCIK